MCNKSWTTSLIITARIRSMTGRYCFHRCLSVNISGGGVPGLSKGKNFWHQIWLDTCSDWKKNFLSRDCPPSPPPPPPPVKGKIFDTRFGLIHVQTGKKNFCRGTPPPLHNSKELLCIRGGRYASCVHAGGLSCFITVNRYSFCSQEHTRERYLCFTFRLEAQTSLCQKV